MGFLMAVGILGSDGLDSVVDRPVLFIAGFLPLGQSRSLTSAIVLASLAVFIYAAVFWFVLICVGRVRASDHELAIRP